MTVYLTKLNVDYPDSFRFISFLVKVYDY